MKKRKKIWLNGFLFFLILGLTVYGVFHGEDMGELREAIRRASLRWLFPAAACVLFFIWGESIIIWYMMDSYGIRLKKKICFLFSAVGFFFSCVTPSASGGQPMQIYFMKKEKISIPVATVILMIVTITYKLVLVVTGLGLLLFGGAFRERYLGKILPVFYLGVGLNVFCVSFMLLLVFHPFLAKQIMLRGLMLLERFHLLRHREGRLKKLEDSMDLYNETAAYLRNHHGLIFRVFLITCVQRAALFAVTCFVVYSFGLRGTPWYVILTLQASIAVSVDMLPLPGGMGISESLFLILFQPVLGELLLPGMVLSRGLGYYSELLISAVFTLAALVYFGRKEKKERR